MCGLCGVLGGGPHWTEGAGRVGAATGTRRAERQRQTAVMNAVLAPWRLKVGDWQGASFVVAGPTGAQEVADSLPAVWDTAGRLLKRKIDPLDPALIARLGGPSSLSLGERVPEGRVRGNVGGSRRRGKRHPSSGPADHLLPPGEGTSR